MGSRGDSSEQKLIEQILEDSRAGTLARIIDHSDSNKDREQLIKNLGAIVIVQAYLGLRKLIGDIPIPDPGKEDDPPEYKESIRSISVERTPSHCRVRNRVVTDREIGTE
jgi:hypothetical protein